MFEHDYCERGLATPDVASWHEYVEKNQEEWKQEADLIMAQLIERHLDPIAGVDAVTAFLRRKL
jgi:alkyl sulfatase BDS1-like metallo-beta-lactamase superfamily hydrolase